MADRQILDTTYLSVHPATLDWWKLREKCLQCRHVMVAPDASSAASAAQVMRCAAARKRAGGNGGGKTVSLYCIDERLEGAACGPAAARFVAKVGKR